MRTLLSPMSILHHSILTPMLNTGLLTPEQVVTRTLEVSEEYEIPLSSLEGFIRQIIGWREFMYGLYESIGRKQRTSNFGVLPVRYRRVFIRAIPELYRLIPRLKKC